MLGIHNSPHDPDPVETGAEQITETIAEKMITTQHQYKQRVVLIFKSAHCEHTMIECLELTDELLPLYEMTVYTEFSFSLKM